MSQQQSGPASDRTAQRVVEDSASITGSPARPQERRPYTILIEDEEFGFSIDVIVIPAPEGVGHNREFQDYGAALEYAQELRRVTGWPLRDLAGG